MTLVECNIIRQECSYIDNLIKDKPEPYVSVVRKSTQEIRQWCDEIEDTFADADEKTKEVRS